MARPKRPPHPMLGIARERLRALDPGLAASKIQLRMLDGPPGAPRYAVSVAECHRQGPCPYGVADELACPILDCALRRSLRMLLSSDGEVIEVIQSGVRWDR